MYSVFCPGPLEASPLPHQAELLQGPLWAPHRPGPPPADAQHFRHADIADSTNTYIILLNTITLIYFQHIFTMLIIHFKIWIFFFCLFVCLPVGVYDTGRNRNTLISPDLRQPFKCTLVN